jgi:type II secretory pathway pseudopilin PulG
VFRPAVKTENGDTLIEILISIMVLSFGVIGVYSALTGSITAADRVKSRASATQLVTQIANEVQLTDWECAENPFESYRRVLDGLKPSSSWTIALRSIRHWGPSRSFEDGCPTPEQGDVFRLQQLNIVVESPGGRTTQNLQLLKRP